MTDHPQPKRRRSRRRPRLIALLALVFAGLAGLVLLQNRQLATQPPAATPVAFARVYPQISSVSDVQAVRLQDPATEATFVLNRTEDGGWAAPGTDGELNEAGAEGIAATVALLPFQRRIEQAEDLATYGLSADGGTLFIQILLADGTGHAVAVGDLTAAGTAYYALVDDRPEVYLLERGAVDFLLVALRNPPIA